MWNFTRPVLHSDLSPKFLSSQSPPLATMLDMLYKGLSVQQTEAAYWLQQTWVLIVGLLGLWVLWEWVIYFLLINSCNCDPLIDNLPNIIEQVWSLRSFCTCLLACCKSASPVQSVTAKVWFLLLATHRTL